MLNMFVCLQNLCVIQCVLRHWLQRFNGGFSIFIVEITNMLEVTVKTLDGKNRTFCVQDDVGFASVYYLYRVYLLLKAMGPPYTPTSAHVKRLLTLWSPLSYRPLHGPETQVYIMRALRAGLTLMCDRYYYYLFVSLQISVKEFKEKIASSIVRILFLPCRDINLILIFNWHMCMPFWIVWWSMSFMWRQYACVFW